MKRKRPLRKYRIITGGRVYHTVERSCRRAANTFMYHYDFKPLVGQHVAVIPVTDDNYRDGEYEYFTLLPKYVHLYKGVRFIGVAVEVLNRRGFTL